MLRNRVAALILGLFASSAAFALGLGPLQSDSYLNEQFSGRIKILNAKPADFDALNAGLASLDQFERAGVAFTQTLYQLKFVVERSDEGKGYISISSRDPIREPYLNFLVELNWAGGRLLREYTVLLAPPRFDSGQKRSFETSATARSTHASVDDMPRVELEVGPMPVTASGAYQGGREIGPVVTSDILRSITSTEDGNARLELVAPGGSDSNVEKGPDEGGSDLLREEVYRQSQRNAELSDKFTEAEEIIDLLERQVNMKDDELATLQARLVELTIYPAGITLASAADDERSSTEDAQYALDDTMFEDGDEEMPDLSDVFESEETDDPVAAYIDDENEVVNDEEIEQEAEAGEDGVGDDVATMSVDYPEESGGFLDSLTPKHIATTVLGAALSILGVEVDEPDISDELRAVRVFYGTNRALLPGCSENRTTTWNVNQGCRPNDYYGPEPAPVLRDNSGLSVGWLTVTLPPEHETGQIERPPRVLTVELRDEDPLEDVLISELANLGTDYDKWAAELQSTGRRDAFVYVHGYATTFADAARRAGQVAADLDLNLEGGFRGIPMFYSWPSGGPTAEYFADHDTNTDAVYAFNQFIDLLKRDAQVERLHIIAHSMGNRLVANALLDRAAEEGRAIDQLVLAAPDIWADRFKNRFLNTLPKFASRVTLYVSDNDRALIASSGMRIGKYRAGQAEGGLLEAALLIDDFDAIDASELDNDFLGHSYYANNDSVLSDIYCLLKGRAIDERPLLRRVGDVWKVARSEDQSSTSSECSIVLTPEAGSLTRIPWVIAALSSVAGFIYFWRRRKAGAAQPSA